MEKDCLGVHHVLLRAGEEEHGVGGGQGGCAEGREVPLREEGVGGAGIGGAEEEDGRRCLRDVMFLRVRLYFHMKLRK